MNGHTNIANDTITVPYYAVHIDGLIAGFFGQFRFLSNFYVLENGIALDGLYYPSVEHAYQAAKWPENLRAQFVGITPNQAKKVGKVASGFNAKNWNKKKASFMASLVFQKFYNNPKLKEMLYLTDGFILEERNSWHDTYWGTDVDGKGENILGKILMKLRDDLRMLDRNDLF